MRREYANAMYKKKKKKLRKQREGISSPPPIWGVRPVQDPDGSDLKKPVGNRIKTWKLVPSYYRCKKDKERCGL